MFFAVGGGCGGSGSQCKFIVDDTRGLLATTVLSCIPVEDFNFCIKCFYLAIVHEALDADRIVHPGSRDENRQFLIKWVPTATVMPAQPGQPSQAEHKEKLFLMELLLRQVRRLEIGNKFSSRHGQKGVVGFIDQQEDDKDCLTLGFTSEHLLAYIYMGPIYYQKLKQMVIDKIPLKVGHEGRLRLDEMKCDCLIGHGGSMLLLEQLMLYSNTYKLDLCRTCNLLSYLHWCCFCHLSSAIASLHILYVCKLLF
ncbi:hypothetical protein HPB49_001445 [Dermacentor silvarum]|uniref:Uncharacterized protein n=1 Tax=Dermacentor silvarum TaxID=543639 RepID=A0ACB8C6L5_DERSI|nr:hypothetical protein HPB49_001445 [Dermacentor silvarum]